MAKILTRLRIDEVASVDRGAGEGVKIMLMKREDEPYWKREFTAEQRSRDAKSGAAESDGSYPIHDASDLHNAMQAVGRSKNPEKTKAHIRSRARALGLTDKLSDAFKRDIMGTKFSDMFAKIFGGSNTDNSVVIDKALTGLAESVGSIVTEAATPEVLSAELSKTFEQFGEHLKSTLTAGPAVVKKEESDMDLAVLKKALGLADTATDVEVTAAITKSLAAAGEAASSVKKMEKELLIAKAEFTPAELTFYSKESQYDEEENDGDNSDTKDMKRAKKAFRLASHADRAVTMKSAEPPVPAYIQKILDDNAEMRKQLGELQAGGSLVALSKQAIDIGLPEAEGATIQKALKGDKEAVDKLLGFVKSAIATAREGGVFKEFGSSSGTGVITTALDELNAMAVNLQKSDPKLSKQQAFAKVYENPDNAVLVRRERQENSPSPLAQ